MDTTSILSSLPEGTGLITMNSLSSAGLKEKYPKDCTAEGCHGILNYEHCDSCEDKLVEISYDQWFDSSNGGHKDCDKITDEQRQAFGGVLSKITETPLEDLEKTYLASLLSSLKSYHSAVEKAESLGNGNFALANEALEWANKSLDTLRAINHAKYATAELRDFEVYKMR